MLFEDQDNSTQFTAQILRCLSRSGPAQTKNGDPEDTIRKAGRQFVTGWLDGVARTR